MKRDSTVFYTPRHLISTFFGFVSREKKLEGIANITHTHNRETTTTRVPRAQKQMLWPVFERRYMKMENKLVVLHPSSQTRRQQMQRNGGEQKIEKNLISLFYKRIKKVQERLCRAAIYSV